MIPLLDDRFWSKVDKDGPNGCWVWKAYIEKSGYGKFNYNGRIYRIHRLVYEAMVKEIPQGMVIDHLCRNRSCCNPNHLECVTLKENTKRGLAGELHTHCLHGHELTPENTYYANTKNGLRRNCRACVLASQYKKYKDNPEPKKQRSKKWWNDNKDKVNSTRRNKRVAA